MPPVEEPGTPFIAVSPAATVCGRPPSWRIPYNRSLGAFVQNGHRTISNSEGGKSSLPGARSPSPRNGQIGKHVSGHNLHDPLEIGSPAENHGTRYEWGLKGRMSQASKMPKLRKTREGSKKSAVFSC